VIFAILRYGVSAKIPRYAVPRRGSLKTEPELYMILSGIRCHIISYHHIVDLKRQNRLKVGTSKPKLKVSVIILGMFLSPRNFRVPSVNFAKCGMQKSKKDIQFMVCLHRTVYQFRTNAIPNPIGTF